MIYWPIWNSITKMPKQILNLKTILELLGKGNWCNNKKVLCYSYDKITNKVIPTHHYKSGWFFGHSRNSSETQKLRWALLFQFILTQIKNQKYPNNSDHNPNTHFGSNNNLTFNSDNYTISLIEYLIHQKVKRKCFASPEILSEIRDIICECVSEYCFAKFGWNKIIWKFVWGIGSHGCHQIGVWYFGRRLINSHKHPNNWEIIWFQTRKRTDHILVLFTPANNQEVFGFI